MDEQRTEQPYSSRRGEINKPEQPYEEGDLGRLGTSSSYDSCRFSDNRLSSPVLKDVEYITQREGVNQLEEFPEVAFDASREIGRKLANTSLEAQIPSSHGYNIDMQDHNHHTVQSNSNQYTQL